MDADADVDVDVELVEGGVEVVVVVVAARVELLLGVRSGAMIMTWAKLRQKNKIIKTCRTRSALLRRGQQASFDEPKPSLQLLHRARGFNVKKLAERRPQRRSPSPQFSVEKPLRASPIKALPPAVLQRFHMKR